MKTIKTRNKVRDIKILDKSANLSTRMKNTFVRTKTSAEQTHDPHHATPTDYATNSIQDKAQGVARGTVRHIPNPRKKIRENLDRAKGHFQEAKRNLPSERKHAAKQAQKTSQKTKSEAENLKNTANTAKDTAQDAKKAVDDAKRKFRETRQSVQNAKRGGTSPRTGSAPRGGGLSGQPVHTSTPGGGVTRPGYLNRGVIGQKSGGNAAKSLDKTAKAVKSTKKGFKKTAKGTIKTAKKSVKTAEKTAKQAVKTAQRTAKTAQKSAQAAVKAAKAAEKAARAAAKAAIQAAKLTVKAITAMIKIAVAAIKGFIAFLAAGGWIVVLVVLLIAMILLLLDSIFGIFASSEPNPDTGQTINSVIAEIDAEYTAKIDEIVSANAHDLLDMSGARAAWKQVLAVYTVRTVSDPDNPMSVAMMDDANASILRTVFWEMNTITHTLDKVEVEEDELGDDGLPTGEKVKVSKTVLRITVTHKTADEMAAQYAFNDEQKEWLAELLKPEYHSLWNALLYGITSVGNGSMIEVAETQLGNVGGEPYWRWYGFESRVAWCACFVSWCADQAGYIDAGIIPRFSLCDDGITWFKNKGQWQDSGYTPAPGDIIFFDWDGDGYSDHVGIVERVEGDKVHTIEGNTSDTCARRSYPLNSSQIQGYGIPIY